MTSTHKIFKRMVRGCFLTSKPIEWFEMVNEGFNFSSHRRRFVCGSPCAGKRTRPTHYTAVMANAVTNDRPRQWADGRLGSNCSFRRRLQAGLRRLHRRGPGKGRAGAKKPREGTRQRASASVLSRQRPVPCACCEPELGGSGCLSRCRPASPDGQN